MDEREHRRGNDALSNALQRAGSSETKIATLSAVMSEPHTAGPDMAVASSGSSTVSLGQSF